MFINTFILLGVKSMSTNIIQFNLFSDAYLIEKKRKKQPQWDKFYSVFAFDEIKYHKLLADYFKEHNLNGIYDLTKNELHSLKKQCYIISENGLLKHRGDEKHIFRYAVLYKIQSELCNYIEHTIPENDNLDLNNGLVIWKESYESRKRIINELQIEIKGTERLSLYERVKKHIKLLRLLKKGWEVKEAVKLCH